MANQKILETTTTTIKTWTFHKGHMDLKFDLDIEVKTDMVDFLELLQAAVKRLEEQINN